MSLSTPNSSFIFERRRRSIRLCAVLRAILRPAVVPLPFVLRAPAVAGFAAAVDVEGSAASVFLEDGARGFIWMILRERVGGGGRAES